MPSLGTAVETPIDVQDVLDFIDTFMQQYSTREFVTISEMYDFCLDIRLLLSSN
jgi:hypothetical protein